MILSRVRNTMQDLRRFSPRQPRPVTRPQTKKRYGFDVLEDRTAPASLTSLSPGLTGLQAATATLVASSIPAQSLAATAVVNSTSLPGALGAPGNPASNLTATAPANAPAPVVSGANATPVPQIIAQAQNLSLAAVAALTASNPADIQALIRRRTQPNATELTGGANGLRTEPTAKLPTVPQMIIENWNQLQRWLDTGPATGGGQSPSTSAPRPQAESSEPILAEDAPRYYTESAAEQTVDRVFQARDLFLPGDETTLRRSAAGETDLPPAPRNGFAAEDHSDLAVGLALGGVGLCLREAGSPRRAAEGKMRRGRKLLVS
jgi:hypothetical protein